MSGVSPHLLLEGPYEQRLLWRGVVQAAIVETAERDTALAQAIASEVLNGLMGGLGNA